MIRVWLTLAGVVAFIGVAAADEPGPEPRRSPRAAPRVKVERRVVEQVPVRAYPRLVPDCHEAFFAELLKCAPRVYIEPNDLVVLNQLDAFPAGPRRPYPSLFSWDINSPQRLGRELR